jgi:hypothetical protein
MKKPTKKMKKWMAWFKQVLKDYKCTADLTDSCKQHLIQNGFILAHRGISNAVWVNSKKRIVIKRPFITVAGAGAGGGHLMGNQKMKAMRIQTLVGPYGWMVQPLCQTYNANVAHRKVKAVAAKINQNRVKKLCGDLHEGNVGHYRNQVVIFDW